MRDPRLQRFCKRYKISLPADPDDWDDIVIRAVEFPTLDMLRNTRGHTKVEVLVMSRTAIATNDVGMAKRALAYLAEKQCEHNLAGDGNPTIECTCSDTRPFREYVGESLWNRLNDMIAEKDADTDPS